ncbi:MAG: site-2 protease family protein [Pseudonocardiales bacterium]|nr:site-2 protease family protein [Pseudonocardiales bacterium]
MMFALGVLVFALGIGVSIALHEAGHMWTAKAFGMKVRRYFIGFGPTIFSWRRGETEYGLKAIPAGGFCDIAGMTGMDPVTEDEAPRAFFRKPTWQRVIVLSAGSTAHFIIGVIVLYVLAVTLGLPAATAVAGDISCAAASVNPATGVPTPCDASVPSPAAAAGLRAGDEIVSVAGTPTPTFLDVATVVRQHLGPTPIVVNRDGQLLTLVPDVAPVMRLAAGAKPNDPTNRLESVGAIGVGPKDVLEYSPLTAVPGTAVFTGRLFDMTWQGLLRFPQKVPTVLRAIAGEPRDRDSPISVVGASIIGGDAAEQGQWLRFGLLLAALNFFIGVFNLLPLLPLDGGHIAVNLYERVRDTVRRRQGKVKMPPVDYTRLLPLTYAFIVVLGAVSLLTITADIVNPIHLK